MTHKAERYRKQVGSFAARVHAYHSSQGLQPRATEAGGELRRLSCLQGILTENAQSNE